MTARPRRIAASLLLLGCTICLTGCINRLASRNSPLVDDLLCVDQGQQEQRGLAAGRQETTSKQFADEMEKARRLERGGKLAEANAIYKKLVMGHPDRHEPYHRMGVVADQQRRHRDAEGLFRQALRLNRRDAEVVGDLGYCLYLQGKLPQAENALSSAVRMDPKAARHHNNLGLVLGRQGKFEAAMKQFRAGGSEADAYYNLAFVKASHDAIGDAKICFRRALAADPNHQRARRALASFQRADADSETLAGRSPGKTAEGRLVSHLEDELTEGDSVRQALHLAPAEAE